MTASEFVRLPGFDGMTLAADAYGARDAPVVLLLHGGGQTRHSWGGTAGSLAEAGFRAIAVDARGHGESDWDAAKRYDPLPFALDLQAMTRTFARPVAVVGASLGGNTGMLAHGELDVPLAALVLVDIGPKIQKSGVDRIYEFMNQKPEGFASLDEVADAVASYQPHRERPRDVSGLAKNLRQMPNGRYRWHWDPAFLEVMFQPRPDMGPRLEAAAKNLRCPVKLVRGRKSDLLSEADARLFLDLCPSAEYVDVQDAGHMVAGDVNDRFTAAVIDFLGRKMPRDLDGAVALVR